MRGQVVLQVNGDEPDGARGTGGLGVLFTANDVAQLFQRYLCTQTGGLDALVELLAGGNDLLGNVLALSVNDGLRYLGVFAVGGHVGRGGGEWRQWPDAIAVRDQLDGEHVLIVVEALAKALRGIVLAVLTDAHGDDFSKGPGFA